MGFGTVGLKVSSLRLRVFFDFVSGLGSAGFFLQPQ